MFFFKVLIIKSSNHQIIKSSNHQIIKATNQQINKSLLGKAADCGID
jgi:hypothetical protein